MTAALSYSGIVFPAFWASPSSATGARVAWLGMALIVIAGIIAVQLQPGARRNARRR